MINHEHLLLFILSILQQPFVSTATLIIGFYIALVFGSVILGIIQPKGGD